MEATVESISGFGEVAMGVLGEVESLISVAQGVLEVAQESIDRAKLRQTEEAATRCWNLPVAKKTRSVIGKKVKIKIWKLNSMRDESYGICSCPAVSCRTRLRSWSYIPFSK